MQTIIINNVEFNNFGANNYSCGMQLISCYPAPKNIVQDVLSGKYPNVYLNPSAKCGSEFFGLYGTKEQYENLYKEQKEAQISKQLIDKLGWDMSDLEKYEKTKNEIIANYKDWWE